MMSPTEILNYVLENELDYKFLSMLAFHRNGYSIGEIADKKLLCKPNNCRLISYAYDINIKIEDDEICTAIINGLYISAFISRQNDARQVHFLVHQYPKSMKGQFEEQIAREVVQYMIMHGIISMRLDNIKKVQEYLGI